MDENGGGGEEDVWMMEREGKSKRRLVWERRGLEEGRKEAIALAGAMYYEVAAGQRFIICWCRFD